MRIILTGATGMVGEGVLFECLADPAVTEVLLVNRRAYPGAKHAKLKECLVPDFLHLDGAAAQLAGYDACFFCAGVSSVGMNEADYTRVTYDLTIGFAQKLASLNPNMVFVYVTGAGTDGSEKGSIMWARVKGRTENALTRMPFKAVYNFRPAIMKPSPGQQNLKWFMQLVTLLFPLVAMLAPKQALTLQQVGRAMIHSVTRGFSKQVLDVVDIQELAKG